MLADILVHHVLADAHSCRLAVLPFCPAVRTFIAEHPEFSPLVPAAWQERLPSPPQHKPADDDKTAVDFVGLTGSRRARLQETTLESDDVAGYLGADGSGVPPGNRAGPAMVPDAAEG